MKKMIFVSAAATSSLASLFISFALSSATAQTRVGPSFDCGAAGVATQPLAQMICSSEELSKTDLAYVMAYQALRQSSDDQEGRMLATEANAFVQATMETCNIPRVGKISRPPSPQEISCLKGRYEKQRAQLLGRLRGDALEEAKLAPEEALEIQRELKRRALLPESAAIDGVFGPTTRTAIAEWQRSVGQRATGFASRVILTTVPFTSGPQSSSAQTVTAYDPRMARPSTNTPAQTFGSDPQRAGNPSEWRVDCAVASTPADKAICSNPGLSQLDRSNADLFKSLQPTTEAERSRRLAAYYAHRRSFCDANVQCLTDIYDESLRTFRFLYRQVTGAGVGPTQNEYMLDYKAFQTALNALPKFEREQREVVRQVQAPQEKASGAAQASPSQTTRASDDGAANPSPQGKWIADPKTGCRVWDGDPQPGETISWTGDCQNSLALGRGVLLWFKDGKPNGRYEGGYLDGKASGLGIFTGSNGNRYEGEWLNDEMNGRGVYTEANNGNRYDGDWRNGKKEGRGVHTDADGRYDGEWRDDKRNGRGVFTGPNGERYEGEWRNDDANGRGVFTYPNGDRYDGELLNNRPNGSGTYTAAAGNTVSGTWTNGCLRRGESVFFVNRLPQECQQEMGTAAPENNSATVPPAPKQSWLQDFKNMFAQGLPGPGRAPPPPPTAIYVVMGHLNGILNGNKADGRCGALVSRQNNVPKVGEILDLKEMGIPIDNKAIIGREQYPLNLTITKTFGPYDDEKKPVGELINAGWDIASDLFVARSGC